MSGERSRDEFDSLESLANRVRRNLFGDSRDEWTDSQLFRRGVGVRRQYSINNMSNMASSTMNEGDRSREGLLNGGGDDDLRPIREDVNPTGGDGQHPDPMEQASQRLANGSRTSMRGNGSIIDELRNSRMFLPRRSNQINVEAVIENDGGRGSEYVEFVDNGEGGTDRFVSPTKDETPKETRDLRREVANLRRAIEQMGQREELLHEDIEVVARGIEYANQRVLNVEKERDAYREELTQAWATANAARGPSDDDYINLKGAVQMVREFSGENTQKLDAFLSQCETARKAVLPTKQNRLLEMIVGTKLEGKALLQLKHKKITSFEILKRELEALFGTSKSLLEWQVEFNKLQQKENEDVSKFAARAERVTAELVAAIQNTLPGKNEDFKEGMSASIFTLAKANFEQGLRGQLQILVRANNYHTLHESCLGAIALEKTISNNTAGRSKVITTSEISLQSDNRQSIGRRSLNSANCFKYQQPGHQAKDCTLQQGGQRKTILPVASDHRSVNAFNQVCKFCKRSGHSLKTCHALRRELGEDGSHVQSFNSKPSDHQSEKQHKKNNASDPNFSPVGAYQIFAIKPEAESTISTSFEEPGKARKKVKITPASPGNIKNKLVLCADELKGPTVSLADSGAETSVIRIDCLQEGAKLEKGGHLLRGIAAMDVPTVGKVELFLKVGDEEIGHDFHVMPATFPYKGGILGEDFLESPTIKANSIPGEALVIRGTRLEYCKGKEPVVIGARTEMLAWAPTRSVKEGIVRKQELKHGVFMGESFETI